MKSKELINRISYSIVNYLMSKEYHFEIAFSAHLNSINQVHFNTKNNIPTSQKIPFSFTTPSDQFILNFNFHVWYAQHINQNEFLFLKRIYDKENEIVFNIETNPEFISLFPQQNNQNHSNGYTDAKFNEEFYFHWRRIQYSCMMKLFQKETKFTAEYEGNDSISPLRLMRHDHQIVSREKIFTTYINTNY